MRSVTGDGGPAADTLGRLAGRLGELFARPEPHRQALRYMTALLDEDTRGNSRQLARATGDDSPWRMQRLLNRAHWDADRMRDVLVELVADHFGDPAGVLALGELGVAKRGRGSVAVQRQYNETTGGVDNCQLALLATYVSPAGAAVVDRELYLPPSWAEDPRRCERARVPRERIRPASAAELAGPMVHRLAARGLPVSWVAGGVRYGTDPALRERLEHLRLPYALAVPASHRVRTPFLGEVTVNTLAEAVPAVGWRPGVRGSRWARIGITERPDGTPVRTGAGPRFAHTLLLRLRPDRARPEHYLVHAPEPTGTGRMVSTVDTLEAGERSVRALRTRTGLDSYEVRGWIAWYRHMTLALLAMAATLTGRSGTERNHLPMAN